MSAFWQELAVTAEVAASDRKGDADTGGIPFVKGGIYQWKDVLLVLTQLLSERDPDLWCLTYLTGPRAGDSWNFICSEADMRKHFKEYSVSLRFMREAY